MTDKPPRTYALLLLFAWSLACVAVGFLARHQRPIPSSGPIGPPGAEGPPGRGLEGVYVVQTTGRGLTVHALCRREEQAISGGCVWASGEPESSAPIQLAEGADPVGWSCSASESGAITAFAVCAVFGP